MIEAKSGVDFKTQSLFFEEKCMQDEKFLTDYPKISNGSAVYLAIKPLKIETLDCFGEKSILNVPRKKVTRCIVFHLNCGVNHATMVLMLPTFLIFLV